MPLMYQLDADRGIVTITGDYAEPAEWRTLLGTVLRDPHYRRGSSFIRDLRASKNPVDVHVVMGIIVVVRDFWGHLGAHRAAIVTGSGTDAPAVVAEALAGEEHLPVRAFTSMADAVEWVQQR